VLGSIVDHGQLITGAWRASAAGLDGEARMEEGDEAKPRRCSAEHGRRRRGGAMVAKSGGGSNSVREQRNARESSRVRGRGAEWSGGEACLL
jgi:hypothetical protein